MRASERQYFSSPEASPQSGPGLDELIWISGWQSWAAFCHREAVRAREAGKGRGGLARAHAEQRECKWQAHGARCAKNARDGLLGESGLTGTDSFGEQ